MEHPIQILLIEDSDFDAKLVANVLRRTPELQVSLDHVESLGTAVATLHEKHYDVAILDLGLPDNAGLEAVPKLKAAAPATPVVVLSGQNDDEIAVEAIRRGAQEYLSKEHVMGHLLVRVVRHSIARQKQLIDAQAQALTDVLTGIGNRRAFDMELTRRLGDFARHRTPVCVAIFDIDHFKRINDTRGHDIGDQIIQQVASTLENEVRATDLATRFGGEEFAVIFPSTRLTKATPVAERVRIAIGRECDKREDLDVSVTTSCGVAEVVNGEDGQCLLRRADEALYAAKDHGRNCCQVHTGQHVQPMQFA